MPPYYFTTALLRPVRASHLPIYIQSEGKDEAIRAGRKKSRLFRTEERSEVIFLSNSSSPVEDNQKCLISFSAPRASHAWLSHSACTYAFASACAETARFRQERRWRFRKIRYAQS